ncbi:MAG: hypothetical protein J3K34DRAFT_221087 [Monoraphidium minutum]|nr:MAG: hypothetical protein J3K34DRAFT_221087 [Monoraphidium minutum]
MAARRCKASCARVMTAVAAAVGSPTTVAAAVGSPAAAAATAVVARRRRLLSPRPRGHRPRCAPRCCRCACRRRRRPHTGARPGRLRWRGWTNGRCCTPHSTCEASWRRRWGLVLKQRRGAQGSEL